MKKKELDAKEEHCSKDASHNGINQEDMLELDNLLDVQGGQDEDKQAGSCGLGCFSGAVYQEQTSQNDDRKG